MFFVGVGTCLLIFGILFGESGLLSLGCFLTVTVGFIAFVKQRCRRMTLLKRNGIPGPKPNWFSGNLTEYLNTPNVIWDEKLVKEYGPVCGFYMGAKPIILISDPELIDKIQARKGTSEHFLHRPRRVPGGINPDPKRAKMLGNVEVPLWKLIRGILDKAFSPMKLNSMSCDIEKLIQTFMSQIAPYQEIDFYQILQNLTLDLIGKTGFGIDSNIQENPNEALKAAVEEEFSKSTGTLLLKLYLCLPEVQKPLHKLRVTWQHIKTLFGFGGESELWKLGAKTVEERKNNSKKATDLLQSMLDSKKLDEEAIVANSVLFFEAGFETLSASLAFIIYLLMKNLEIQDSVRNEIFNVLKGHADWIEKLKEMKFLDAVINEGLRMYPPQTTFIGRSGSVDLHHEYVWQGSVRRCIIPKNVHVQVCLTQILNDADIWDQPRIFNPYRFLSWDKLNDKQKIAFQPFGRGKRICIGRKYADRVIKMVLVTLMSKYRIIPLVKDEEDKEMEVNYKTATMTPKRGVFGKVEWKPLFPSWEGWH